jgi:putative restriction endonuclease
MNQNNFHSSFLLLYYQKRCVADVAIPNVLRAGYIIAWSSNKEQSTNPRNGLRPAATHNSAFDKGLVNVTTDYKGKNFSCDL